MNEKIGRRVTVKDVARLAEVSVATVSRVVSGKGYVSKDAMEKVTKAINTLNYSPDGSARSLKIRQTMTIGLLITDITNPYYYFLADGVLDSSKKLGYHVILCVTNEDPETEKEYLKVLMEKRVDGIIAIPTGKNIRFWKQAMSLGLTIVFADRELSALPEVDSIQTDNIQGAYDATSHLISLGHKSIGIISGPLSTTTGKGRYEGYVKALKDANIKLNNELVQYTDFKKESGIKAIQSMLSVSSLPTAIFVANNVLGEASIKGIKQKGLRIPDDISIIIFDDVPYASLISPAITVVSQPAYEIGYLSCERLVNLATTESSRGQSVKTVLSSKMIFRESCKEV